MSYPFMYVVHFCICQKRKHRLARCELFRSPALQKFLLSPNWFSSKSFFPKNSGFVSYAIPCLGMLCANLSAPRQNIDVCGTNVRDHDFGKNVKNGKHSEVIFSILVLGSNLCNRYTNDLTYVTLQCRGWLSGFGSCQGMGYKHRCLVHQGHGHLLRLLPKVGLNLALLHPRATHQRRPRHRASKATHSEIPCTGSRGPGRLPPPWRLPPTHGFSIAKGRLGRDPRAQKCKYVYIARNPKDVYITYHRFESRKSWSGLFEPSWESCVGHVLSGGSAEGDRFERGKGWWKTSKKQGGERDKSNILFLTHEALEHDTLGQVRRIAEFLELGCAQRR